MEEINGKRLAVVIVLIVSVVGAAFFGGTLFAAYYKSLYGSLGMLGVLFHFGYLLMLLLGSIVELALVISRAASHAGAESASGD